MSDHLSPAHPGESRDPNSLDTSSVLAELPTSAWIPAFAGTSGDEEMARYLENRQLLTDGHAYSPGDERDACGVGLVCALDGKPRREVVELALRALFEAADLQAYAAVAQAQTPADNDGRLSALESLLDEMEIN